MFKQQLNVQKVSRPFSTVEYHVQTSPRSELKALEVRELEAQTCERATQVETFSNMSSIIAPKPLHQSSSKKLHFGELKSDLEDLDKPIVVGGMHLNKDISCP
jgi:hypothetical protein